MKVLKSLKNHVMKASRGKKLDHFYTLCDRSATVLDVGVTGNERNSQVNLFLNEFRFDSCQYTGLAVEPMDKLRDKHPGKRFVEYPGGVFPFEDNAFDWVFSNAVIEHVGGRGQQIEFINEMVRVGRNVFFTTPNKYFPVEAHTNTLFRHWFDEWFYAWLDDKQLYWSRENLVLLGYGDLVKLMEDSSSRKYEVGSNRLLGYPMTYTVVCTS